MTQWELLITAIGLSMDAFAVSICKGLSVRRCAFRHMLICGLYFSIFQAMMPFIGFMLGGQFETLVSSVAPYIAFVLLALIGMHMIRESREEDMPRMNNGFGPLAMIPPAIATSIDALAVGVSLAFLHTNIITAMLLIGGVTLVVCIAGVKIGSLFGSRYRANAELFGGVILVLLGVKILVSHLL